MRQTAGMEPSQKKRKGNGDEKRVKHLPSKADRKKRGRNLIGSVLYWRGDRQRGRHETFILRNGVRRVKCENSDAHNGG